MLAVTRVESPRPTGEVDDVVLAGARRGEVAASRAFFAHYQRAVFAFVWRMLSPRATRGTVEDLVQDTFVRAFAALPRFTPDGAARPSSWLLTIATRVVLNELRRGKRRPADAASAAGEVELVALPGGASPAEAAERKALGALLARAIGELPPDQRAVFLLREYHDRSYDDIAEALGIPIGTVQSRLGRARAALREALKGVV